MRHDAGGQALAVAAGLSGGRGGIEPLVFPQADGPLPLAGRGGIDRAAGIFENACHVVAVENGKVGVQAQRAAVFAQQAHAQSVKGADHRLFGPLADQFARTFAHLGGGLVGEGDGKNPFGRHASLDQAADFLGDDPGFARTGPGQHQARAVQVIDSFLLRLVQAGFECVGHGEKMMMARKSFTLVSVGPVMTESPSC